MSFLREALLLFLLGPLTRLVVGDASSDPIPQVTTLNFDDVILVAEDGSHSIIKDWELNNLMVKNEDAEKRALSEARARAAKIRRSTSASPSDQDEHGGNIIKNCKKPVEVQVLSDASFLNIDIGLSSVVEPSQSNFPTNLAVQAGFSISDAIEVSQSVVALLDKVMTWSLGIGRSRSWTSSAAMAYNFPVPTNNYAIIVSNPYVHRLTGKVLIGCINDWKEYPFVSDTYSNKSWQGIPWPSGIIRVCNSTVYPIPYCIGDGEHK